VTATKIFTDIYKKYVSNKYTGIIALAISMVCAFAFNLGLIEAIGEFMGVPFIFVGWLGIFAHIVDTIFTGVIYTKGANSIHDIIKQLHPEMEVPIELKTTYINGSPVKIE